MTLGAGGPLGDPRPLELGAEPAGEPEEPHPEIGRQRPYGIGEGGGAVALDRCMGGPGKAVAGDRQRQQPPPAAGDGRGDRDQDDQAGAGIMQRAGAGARMLAQEEGPNPGPEVVGIGRGRGLSRRAPPAGPGSPAKVLDARSRLPRPTAKRRVWTLKGQKAAKSLCARIAGGLRGRRFFLSVGADMAGD